MEEPVLLYLTCANKDEAKTIARTLIDERLIACANILGKMTSVYRWEGTVVEDEEIAVLLKTRRDMATRATERVKELHSYDLPCVVGLPIQGGNPDFIGWLNCEVS
ncbi:MAG: divalent-cation tolerance protein CutA [Alphaproteobacteria bacterium]